MTEDHAKLAQKFQTADVMMEKLTRDNNVYKEEMLSDKKKLRELNRQVEILQAREVKLNFELEKVQ